MLLQSAFALHSPHLKPRDVNWLVVFILFLDCTRWSIKQFYICLPSRSLSARLKFCWISNDFDKFAAKANVHIWDLYVFINVMLYIH